MSIARKPPKRIRVSFTIVTDYPENVIGQWQLPACMNADVPEGSNPIYDEVLRMAWKLSLGSIVDDFELSEESR